MNNDRERKRQNSLRAYHRGAHAHRVMKALVTAAKIANDRHILDAIDRAEQFVGDAPKVQPVKQIDKRRAVIEALQLDSRQSNRTIADDCGVSEGTVRNIRRQLENAAQITHTDTSIGADGVERRKPTSREE